MQLPGCGELLFSNSNNQTNDSLKAGDLLKHGIVSLKTSYHLFILITIQAYSFRCLQTPEGIEICKDSNEMLISGQQWLCPSTHTIKGNAYFQKHKAQICGSVSAVPPVSWLWYLSDCMVSVLTVAGAQSQKIPVDWAVSTLRTSPCSWAHGLSAALAPGPGTSATSDSCSGGEDAGRDSVKELVIPRCSDSIVFTSTQVIQQFQNSQKGFGGCRRTH